MSRNLLILAICLTPALGAQSRPVRVPFVGCESSGQLEALPAPKGKSVPVSLSPAIASRLAYYKSADGFGLLGPRGWSCEGLSGSSGAVLFVAPDATALRDRIVDHLPGPAIELYEISSGAGSGSREVAELMARFFPERFPMTKEAWEDTFGTDVPPGPFPRDTLRRSAMNTVEFTTPPQTEGLGTRFSWLKAGSDPISGTVVLIDRSADQTDAVYLVVRLPAVMAHLSSAIIADVEREAAKSAH
jgi:hypothetical protein